MSLDKSQALNAAKQYVLQRKVQAAAEIYLRIIEADPSDLAAINTLGDLYASTGRSQDAIAQFSRLAKSCIERGLTRQAIATLKKMTAVDPANLEIAIKLADTYAQAGLPSEARQHYLQIADALTRNGRAPEALSVYRKVVDLDPSNPSTRIKLAELFLRAGMNDQAYEAFVTAADHLASQSENRRALTAYNEALAIRPDSAEALAAARKLSASLGGSDPDQSLRGSAMQTGEPVGPVPGNSAADAPGASTARDEEAHGSDSFVVQEISKAEILVAYGQVNQAVSMLRDVLRNKPDSIDVHIKLKDIYLRTGMMTEAARECLALERIYNARGESERARDYAVRASRLTQSLEPPSGDLPKPTRKPVAVGESRVDAAPPRVASPAAEALKSRPITSRLETTPAPMSQMTIPVVPSEATAIESPIHPGPDRAAQPDAEAPKPRPVVNRIEALPAHMSKTAITQVPSVASAGESPIRPVPEMASALQAGSFEANQPQPNASSIPVVPSEKPQVESAILPAPDMAVPSQSVTVETLTPVAEAEFVEARPRETALALTTHVSGQASARPLPALFASSLPVKYKRSRLTAAAVAAGILALLGIGAVIGGFVYDSQLDKQYQTLVLAAPPSALPATPTALASDEPPPLQENEAITVDVPSSPQPDASAARKTPEPEAIRRVPPSQPQPSTEPPKVATKPSPSLPRTAVGADNRGGTETGSPAGVPSAVPVAAPQPAEPPQRALRQSPGVVVGGAVKRVDPVYPAEARAARQGGAVTVEVTISEQGNVTSARALSGPPLLRSAAVTAARAWKFKASTLGGVPVSTSTTIVFNFKL